MSRRTLPSGYRAVYRGKRYRSDSGDGSSVTLWDEETGANEVATVPIEDLDEWYRIRTVGTYVGEPFKVNAEMDDGTYWISFDGGNGRKIADEWEARKDAADGSRHWQEDRYTFMATVPKAEVHDVREDRFDLLGPWRAAKEQR
ncbi:hypothetical protein [Actinophytocola sp.]|jgi:hypothetical protein|uniref:hypothetical protein n=1 Tax=Actinophytocola sp. TaxID=1872138 RepID=UPI002ED79C99